MCLGRAVSTTCHFKLAARPHHLLIHLINPPARLEGGVETATHGSNMSLQPEAFTAITLKAWVLQNCLQTAHSELVTDFVAPALPRFQTFSQPGALGWSSGEWKGSDGAYVRSMGRTSTSPSSSWPDFKAVCGRPVEASTLKVMVVVLTVVTYTLAPAWKKPARDLGHTGSASYSFLRRYQTH